MNVPSLPLPIIFRTIPTLLTTSLVSILAGSQKRRLPKDNDDRIGITVIKIVAAFLSSVVDAVVYVCDPSDGRDAVRFRKFRQWYSQAEPRLKKVFQITKEVDAGGMTLYTALLVHEDNPLRQRFVQAYFELLTKNP